MFVSLQKLQFVILSEAHFASRRTRAAHTERLTATAVRSARSARSARLGPLPYYAFAAASTALVSIEIPGPIEELSVHPLMYFPLATDGFALITLVITTVAFSTSLSGEKEILPTGTCTSAVLSVRNSTLPAFTSCTALATSKVTVPVLGFGIRPLGPSTLPSR